MLSTRLHKISIKVDEYSDGSSPSLADVVQVQNVINVSCLMQSVRIEVVKVFFSKPTINTLPLN